MERSGCCIPNGHTRGGFKLGQWAVRKREYWLGSRSFQRLNPRHILEHSGSPNRTLALLLIRSMMQVPHDFYFNNGEAESPRTPSNLSGLIDMTKV